MSSPAVNKHFPEGTSPFSPTVRVPRAHVTVPRNVIKSFAAAKCILDSSYFTKIGRKRDCLQDGLIPLEERFYALQREYNHLYDAHDILQTGHEKLVAATTELIADVEVEHALNAAKMQLLMQIMNATHVDDLPIARPPAAAPEPKDQPAHAVSPPGSPGRAQPKQEAASERAPHQPAGEEKAGGVPRADARVRFQDNYPDFHDVSHNLVNAFDTAVSFKNEK